MTTYDFNALDTKAKDFAVVNKGVLLAIRQEPKFFISLYQLGGFYVESFYHKKSRSVIHYRSFTNEELLDPYLEQITLSELLPLIKVNAE